MGLDLTVLCVAVELDTVPLVASRGGLREDLAEADVVGIVEHAEQGATALVVVGRQEHGPLARLFGADPARDLLERAPCPVVVVPLR